MMPFNAYEECQVKLQTGWGILGHKHCNCRGTTFFTNSGFKRILSRANPGTPPCRSGQLEKDLGLEASSLRHAARLIIFEIMRSFFLGSKEQATKLAALHWANARTVPHAHRQC
jgi:hypothetical protein